MMEPNDSLGNGMGPILMSTRRIIDRRSIITSAHEFVQAYMRAMHLLPYLDRSVCQPKRQKETKDLNLPTTKS